MALCVSLFESNIIAIMSLQFSDKVLHPKSKNVSSLVFFVILVLREICTNGDDSNNTIICIRQILFIRQISQIQKPVCLLKGSTYE